MNDQREHGRKVARQKPEELDHRFDTSRRGAQDHNITDVLLSIQQAIACSHCQRTDLIPNVASAYLRFIGQCPRPSLIDELVVRGLLGLPERLRLDVEGADDEVTLGIGRDDAVPDRLEGAVDVERAVWKLDV